MQIRSDGEAQGENHGRPIELSNPLPDGAAELTDFSFRTHAGGWPIANRVELGKRPRSSMSPTVVLRDGAPVLAIGSPGGATIIGFTVQAIIAHLDWGMKLFRRCR